ncbi:MAG: cyclic nucleotide-binding domain-containing protein [Spirochaetales bacterium]|nr:cyclic nucleotide-binding domain-containing protein [Spirochaetales bacterium]
MSGNLAFLKHVYFFKDLDNRELRAIASVAHTQTFPGGTYIFREGDEAERFYVLVNGWVGIYKVSHSGEPNLLTRQGPGHVFGEMALVDDLPRSASVVTETKVEVLYLDRKDFVRLLHENPSVVQSVIRSLAAMIRNSNESYVDDLSERNKALEIAYEELKKTQDDLIRAERFSNLGKLVSLIIHDLKNPISIIRGYGELLKIVADDPVKLQGYASKIVRESDRLNDFTRELLDYSRGRMRLEMAPYRVGTVFDRIETLFKEDFFNRNIGLLLTGDRELVLYGDLERVVRALSNLVDNGRKALTDKSGEVAVLVDKESNVEKQTIRFQVKDNGEGIPTDSLEKIFEPFFSRSKGGGTGLGMVSVKNIVEAHGGTILVDSTLGQGTTVTFRLPQKLEINEENL